MKAKANTRQMICFAKEIPVCPVCEKPLGSQRAKEYVVPDTVMVWTAIHDQCPECQTIYKTRRLKNGKVEFVFLPTMTMEQLRRLIDL